MKYEGDHFILSTGRHFYAYAARLAVGDEAAGLATRDLSYGYDGTVGMKFTPEERREIAEYVIARWRKWGGLA